MAQAQRKRLKRLMKDALCIQDRFVVEPVLATTGNGFLKSEGFETLQKIKAGLKKSGRRCAMPQFCKYVIMRNPFVEFR